MSLSIQKANFWKRISAFLFDFIITVMLTVGLATVVSAVVGYDKQNAKLEARYAYFEQTIEEKYQEYGVDFDILENQEEYNKLTEEQKQRYEAAVEDFNEALTGDAEAQDIYQSLFSLSLLIVGVSLLLAILIVQFIVPLFFKNGQTLGKKIFGLAVMRSNCVKLTNPILFIRSILGVYTIDTMFPISLLIMIYFGLLGIVGTVTIGLLLLLQIGVLLGSKYRSSIHDLLSDTIVVDMASQRIFATQEEMLAYKKQLHEEEVARKDYI